MTNVLMLGANGQIARKTTRVFLAHTDARLREIYAAASKLPLQGVRLSDCALAMTGAERPSLQRVENLEVPLRDRHVVAEGPMATTHTH